MVRLSYREFRVRLEWILNDWEELTLTEYYLISICQILDGIWRKARKLTDFNSFIHTFTRAAKTTSPMPEGQARALQSRNVWGKVAHKVKSGGNRNRQTPGPPSR